MTSIRHLAEFFISYDYKAVGMAEHEKASQ
jgi:hypothetical protein